jgi:hypothetical protein
VFASKKKNTSTKDRLRVDGMRGDFTVPSPKDGLRVELAPPWLKYDLTISKSMAGRWLILDRASSIVRAT